MVKDKLVSGTRFKAAEKAMTGMSKFGKDKMQKMTAAEKKKAK